MLASHELNIPLHVNCSQKEIWINEKNGGLVSIGRKKSSYSPAFHRCFLMKGKEVFLFI
jgi:hypothetical protein